MSGDFNPLPGLLIVLIPVIAAFVGMTRDLIKGTRETRQMRKVGGR